MVSKAALKSNRIRTSKVACCLFMFSTMSFLTFKKADSVLRNLRYDDCSVGNKLFMQPPPQGALPRLWRSGAVTAFWASPRFGHPHSQIPSVLGIPVSYYCSVLSIPRYPPGMPKSLVFWSSPPKKCWISRENRKRFGDGFR